MVRKNVIPQPSVPFFNEISRLSLWGWMNHVTDPIFPEKFLVNDICEEIKCRINMQNACYYSLQKILSSDPLSKKQS